MFRKAALTSFGIAATALASALPANAEGYTTRIETRPFYGAVVTLEEGVRVFRPLPPERHVIINPNGQTPVSLGFNDTRVYEYSKSYNYNYSNGGGHSHRRYGARGFYGYGFGKGHHGHYHHGGGVGVPAGPKAHH